MSLTSADIKYIGDIAAAINAYAVSMNTFTAGAAATAQATLATAITTAQTTWADSVNRQGE